jgi:hypothetical protein
MFRFFVKIWQLKAEKTISMGTIKYFNELG